MCALVATSMAGESKKEKRGLLGLGDATFGLPLAAPAHFLSAAPLAYAAAPLIEQQLSQHTHTIERVNVPVPGGIYF